MRRYFSIPLSILYKTTSLHINLCSRFMQLYKQTISKLNLLFSTLYILSKLISFSGAGMSGASDLV